VRSALVTSGSVWKYVDAMTSWAAVISFSISDRCSRALTLAAKPLKGNGWQKFGGQKLNICAYMSLTSDVLPITKTFPPAFAPLVVVRLPTLRFRVIQEGAEED